MSLGFLSEFSNRALLAIFAYIPYTDDTTGTGCTHRTYASVTTPPRQKQKNCIYESPQCYYAADYLLQGN